MTDSEPDAKFYAHTVFAAYSECIGILEAHARAGRHEGYDL